MLATEIKQQHVAQQEWSKSEAVQRVYMESTQASLSTLQLPTDMPRLDSGCSVCDIPKSSV